MKKIALVLFISCACPFLYNNVLKAQDEGSPAYNKCLRDFDIGKVNLSAEQMQEYGYLLADYYTCRAIGSDNVRECDNLKDDYRRNVCVDTFRHYMFWIDFARNGSVPQELRSAHIIGQRHYDEFIKAFKNRDDSVCSGQSVEMPQDCRALIRMDEAFATDWRTRNDIYFMKALKNSDAGQCQKVEIPPSGGGVDVSQACAAVVKRSLEPCKRCRGLEEFRQQYCRSAGR